MSPARCGAGAGPTRSRSDRPGSRAADTADPTLSHAPIGGACLGHGPPGARHDRDPAAQPCPQRSRQALPGRRPLDAEVSSDPWRQERQTWQGREVHSQTGQVRQRRADDGRRQCPGGRCDHDRTARSQLLLEPGLELRPGGGAGVERDAQSCAHASCLLPEALTGRRIQGADPGPIGPDAADHQLAWTQSSSSGSRAR